jgi:hypothetical protein
MGGFAKQKKKRYMKICAGGFNRSGLVPPERKSPKLAFRAFGGVNFGYKPGSHNKHFEYIEASGFLQGRIFAADLCDMPLVQSPLQCLPELLARASVLLRGLPESRPQGRSSEGAISLPSNH